MLAAFSVTYRCVSPWIRICNSHLECHMPHGRMDVIFPFRRFKRIVGSLMQWCDERTTNTVATITLIRASVSSTRAFRLSSTMSKNATGKSSAKWKFFPYALPLWLQRGKKNYRFSCRWFVVQCHAMTAWMVKGNKTPSLWARDFANSHSFHIIVIAIVTIKKKKLKRIVAIKVGFCLLLSITVDVTQRISISSIYIVNSIHSFYHQRHHQSKAAKAFSFLSLSRTKNGR